MHFGLSSEIDTNRQQSTGIDATQADSTSPRTLAQELGYEAQDFRRFNELKASLSQAPTELWHLA